MKIEGKKVNVKKSSSELFSFLKNPVNFEKLMPDNVETFEANDNGFVFALKGMPKVALQLANTVPNSLVEYVSAKENLNFKLNLNISEEDAENSALQIEFEGKFNPFIKMMVEKPLTNFIATLEQNAEKI